MASSAFAEASPNGPSDRRRCSARRAAKRCRQAGLDAASCRAPFAPASFWLPSAPSPRRRPAPDRGPSRPRAARLERSPPSPRGARRRTYSASIASIRHESSAPRSRLSFNSKPRPVTSRQIASPATRKTGRRPSSAAAASNGIGTRSCRGPSSTRISPSGLVEQRPNDLRHIGNVERLQGRRFHRAHANLRRFQAGTAGR